MVSKAPVIMQKMKLVFSVLLFTSLILNTNPALAARCALSAPKNGQVYVIAHRGAHNGIPENSLAAYEKAIELGCDFVEIDVRTTKDNHIVSVHNSSIEAYVSGKSGKIRDMTLAELKSLDIGIRIGDSWKNTRIPTFTEILELCRGKIGIYLDLKDADPEVLIATIKKYRMQHDIVWYVPAFYHKKIMEIKQYCPECLVMPDPGPAKHIEKVAVAYEPQVIASDMDHLSDRFVDLAHKNQCMVFVDDNEDDPAKWELEWKKIIDWGTDGIQTDQPEALIKYLKSNQ
jgi:glycerophosphoryl diester phosphodiesterase